MDITDLLRACIETLRQNSRALDQGKEVRSKIFPGKRSEYHVRAKELSNSITKLRDFLIEIRNPYLNVMAKLTMKNKKFSQGQSQNAVTMSDLERDQIDNDVQKIIQNCQKRLTDFEGFVSSEVVRKNQFVHGHLESVSESLALYLKQVLAVYAEMRAIRVKRSFDYQTVSKLSAAPSFKNSSNNNLRENLKEVKREGVGRRSLSASDQDQQNEDSVDRSGTAGDFASHDIPEEELQILEEENKALLAQMSTLSQEVEQVQSNVVQIAELQQFFTERVLTQEKEMEKIAETVVGTSENIRGGNEQVRQAIQKSADFRAWILFFLLVMSLSLLFLDWYND